MILIHSELPTSIIETTIRRVIIMGRPSDDPWALSNIYAKMDELAEKVSKLVNKAQIEGRLKHKVDLENTDEIQMLEERLKQAEIPIKYTDFKTHRTYHMASDYSESLDVDFLDFDITQPHTHEVREYNKRK